MTRPQRISEGVTFTPADDRASSPRRRARRPRQPVDVTHMSCPVPSVDEDERAALADAVDDERVMAALIGEEIDITEALRRVAAYQEDPRRLFLILLTSGIEIQQIALVLWDSGRMRMDDIEAMVREQCGPGEEAVLRDWKDLPMRKPRLTKRMKAQPETHDDRRARRGRAHADDEGNTSR